MLSRQFCKNFKNIIFYRPAGRDCFCNFNIAKAPFSSYYELPLLLFKEFAPNSINLLSLEFTTKWKPFYPFTVKRKNWSWKKWKWVFSSFYLKGSQFKFLATKSFNSFWLRIYNLCFEAKANLGTFSTRLVIGVALSSCL